MDPQEANLSINWRIDSWFPEIPDPVRKSFRVYAEELNRVNRISNLIPVKSIPVADAVHFADSILASRIIFNDLKGSEITDLGSGNGFPGVVFALLFPNVKVHLIDFDPKKVDFLNNINKLLNLKNITIEIRQIDKIPLGSLKNVMVRGVGSLTKTLILCRKAMAYPSNIYHIKTENWGMELGEIPSQLCSTFEPSLLGEYKLPIGEQKYAVIKTAKIKHD